MLRILRLASAIGFAVPLLAQSVSAPSAADLNAITQRGVLLNEYDQAVWHASDAVQTANPKTVEGQRWIAHKENGHWTVAFGKLNAAKTAFEIHYEAKQQARPQEFSAEAVNPPRSDTGFFLSAAKAVETALADFHGEKRPYNYAVLPTLSSSDSSDSAAQLFVYVYPAQTKPRVYPLGGDVRYLISEDGSKVIEKRQLHQSIIEIPPPGKGKSVAARFHKHVLSDLPEDTDVFHVLTQDPRIPEMVGTRHFLFEVLANGSITIEKVKK